MKPRNLASVPIHCFPGLVGPHSITSFFFFKSFCPIALNKNLKTYYSLYNPNTSLPLSHPTQLPTSFSHRLFNEATLSLSSFLIQES